jgi:hypothetical protein
LTIKRRLKVGKHNALSGDTAPGRTGSSIDGEYSGEREGGKGKEGWREREGERTT